MNIRYRYYFLLLLAGIIACKKDGYKSIETFYYPYKDLEEGKVYIYKSLNAFSPPFDFWFFKSFKQNDTWYLTAQHYDINFNVDQFQLQEMLRTGAYSDSYTLYQIDSSGRSIKMQANVEYGNVFPFKVKDSLGVFLFKISWDDPYKESKSTTLVRNRRYLQDTLLSFGDMQRNGIVFHVAEVAEFDEEGILEVEMSGKEIYLQGVGLVYLKKQINPEISLEYQLDTIVDMDYFLREISTSGKWHLE
jgi:hypothetical protein